MIVPDGRSFAVKCIVDLAARLSAPPAPPGRPSSSRNAPSAPAVSDSSKSRRYLITLAPPSAAAMTLLTMLAWSGSLANSGGTAIVNSLRAERPLRSWRQRGAQLLHVYRGEDAAAAAVVLQHVPAEEVSIPDTCMLCGISVET
ncbi:hypothetical protein MY4824_006356 [Beauveria thailandica]